ncbi:aldo/keto reductase family oxidoreductase [Kineosporia mesophila]|uniref:Aldo/keto reductase family oxidoreductase n=1 Tax=Kineosporia mesophila TaxID=566012 RepID=A0ABP6ZP26_9ACTN|nr:oxidoreductase [Kineosporia mesophila]MCD5354724.1 oxidoreductase [Kineosporia mesophila]
MSSQNLEALQIAPGLSLTRMGFGAMQLAGPNAFGPPRDRTEALAVLRTAVDLGVTHIDTSDFYGPATVNELVAQALHPYPDHLHVVTKVGRVRDRSGSWIPALRPAELRQGVEDNLRRLRLDVLDLVHLRLAHGSPNSSIEEAFSVLADLQQAGLIRHLGLSGASRPQVEQARAIAPVVTVQNLFNIGNRADGALVDWCAANGIAYTPFYPLGGSPAGHGSAVTAVARRHRVGAQQIALAWLLHRSSSILLIPGTSRVSHLRQNLDAARIQLTEQDRADLSV